MSIPFAIYYDYSNYPKPANIYIDPETERRARQLILMGCHFDMEISVDEVKLTCETPDILLSIEICGNETSVIEAIRRLVIRGQKALEQVKRDEVNLILTFVPEAEFLSFDDAMLLAYERSDQLANDVFLDMEYPDVLLDD